MKMKHAVFSQKKAKFFLLSVAISSILYPIPSTFAQSNEAPLVEQLVVTGSRIVRDGYSAPTPTSVVGGEDMEAAAPQHLADLVNQMPQITSSMSPSSAGHGVGGGTAGGNFLNLRGLGSNRVLILLDGKRVVSAANSGIVDISTFPTALVSHVEVVTGGASAAYGSDAVAGVVNFVLDKSFTGFEGSFSTGMTQHQDAESYNGEIVFGTDYANGAGHLLLSAQRSWQDGIDSHLEADRDWYQRWKAFTNPQWAAGDTSVGRYLILPQVGQNNAQPGGLIMNTHLAGTTFGPDGELREFDVGLDDGRRSYGGNANDLTDTFGLRASNAQSSVYGRASYMLNADTEVHTELSYGISESTNISAPMFPYPLTIYADNPYIPEALDLNGVSSFSLSRGNTDLGITKGDNERETTRLTFGVDGSLGELFGGTGTWSAYYQYGRSDVVNEVRDNTQRVEYNLAADAIRNPAVGGVDGVPPGVIICRSRLTDPDNGCKPLNSFGYGNISDEARAYVLGTAVQNVTLRQDVAAASAQFDPFSVAAGPVSVATGVEYREESYETTADAVSIADNWWVGNYKPGQGQYDVTEGFVEVLVPVLQGRPLMEAVDLNLAARYTDYSTSGGVRTWKLGASWELTEQIRLRATRSRDIRAPSLYELFLGGQSGSVMVDDVITSAVGDEVFIQQLTGGNPNLQPETANTNTVGVVVNPNILPGLTASLDYYEIEIEDAVVSTNATTVIQQCYGVGVPAVPSVCNNISLVSNDTLQGAQVFVGGVNANQISMSGYDAQLSYSAPVGSGDFRAGITASFINEYKTDEFNSITDYTNTLDAPEFKARLQSSYNIGSSTTSIIVQHVGDLVYNNYPVGHPDSFVDNKIDSYTKVNLNQTFDLNLFGTNSQVYLLVENLFDRDPSVVAATGNPGNPGTDYATYDVLGRSFRLGVRFEL